MTITLFRSTKEPDVFGFTVDPTGSNLPAQLGPWQSAGAGTVATSYAETNLDGLARRFSSRTAAHIAAEV
jgi:hypothetical protein